MIQQQWPWADEVNPDIYKERADWPKISIVTPSYNQGQFIEETILSILNQNYPNLEYIIIDGGSTDNTVEVIKKYEDRITYWVSEKDNGQAHAINKGFEKATGEIFNWINSDDFLLEKCFYFVANTFMKKKVDIVSLNSVLFREIPYHSYLDFGRPPLKRFRVFSAIVPSHTTFWRKKSHQVLDEKINCAIDYELWMRLFKKNKLIKINLFGGVFRYHNESKSVLKDSDFKSKWDTDFEYIMNKHNLKTPSIFLQKEFYYFTRFYKLYRMLKFKLLQKDIQKTTWPFFNKPTL